MHWMPIQLKETVNQHDEVMYRKEQSKFTSPDYLLFLPTLLQRHNLPDIVEQPRQLEHNRICLVEACSLIYHFRPEPQPGQDILSFSD